ncbi:FadR/GntR family transcriptional regulator [Amphibiibacter pelophylacis]|uniref:FadR/GntR family transcriptional regulator n=1 Tax=Amphibiibacter pelophylacis TaxID=1799477 RepID=A0ACC6P2F4_9BURK
MMTVYSSFKNFNTHMPATPLSKRKTRSLTDEVVAAISQKISDGIYVAGAKLPKENLLIEEYGVSRTVIREAISRLQAHGLAQTKHGIGTFILSPEAGVSVRVGTSQLNTLRDVIAILELRISLESETAGLAAQRRSRDDLARIHQAAQDFGSCISAGTDTSTADIDFHLSIAKATGNHYFHDILLQLSQALIPRRRLGPMPWSQHNNQASYLQKIHEEHLSIVDAISRQDPEGARAAMRTHLGNSRERLRKAQEQALPEQIG